MNSPNKSGHNDLEAIFLAKLHERYKFATPFCSERKAERNIYSKHFLIRLYHWGFQNTQSRKSPDMNL